MIAVIIVLPAAVGGCTFHPRGEREERAAATQAGKPFEKQWEERDVPPLPADPTLDQIVQHALLTNADLEQRYWEWRSAIEQIPQDGTPETTLAINAATGITRGRTSLADTTLTAQNMPSAMIPWPAKLSTAARRSLENALAAGWRFQMAKFELRSKVLAAYYDYALNAELIRLEQTNNQLLQTTVMASEARNRAGMGGQQGLLQARNELDLSSNEIAAMQAQLPSQRATLNALLSREPAGALPVPPALPVLRRIAGSDEELVRLAAQQNPELLALAREVEAHKEGVHLARLQYYPDFSVSVGTDLSGVAQSLAGMVAVPLLRYEAIDAAIHQAEANLRATEALRRQSGNDLKARTILDITTLRDADRQIKLIDGTILPRAHQVVLVTRAAYESGRASVLDLLEGQRSLISLQRLTATLVTVREKRVADLEAIIAHDLDATAKDAS
jgi:outer membrane protein TolC